MIRHLPKPVTGMLEKLNIYIYIYMIANWLNCPQTFLFYYVVLQVSNSFTLLCFVYFYQCQDDTVLVSVNCSITQFVAETLPALILHRLYKVPSS